MKINQQRAAMASMCGVDQIFQRRMIGCVNSGNTCMRFGCGQAGLVDRAAVGGQSGQQAVPGSYMRILPRCQTCPVVICMFILFKHAVIKGGAVTIHIQIAAGHTIDQQADACIRQAAKKTVYAKILQPAQGLKRLGCLAHQGSRIGASGMRA